jgi:TorA maturation chaperone TorD
VSARAELIRALAAAAEPPTPMLTAVAGALGLPRVPTAAEHTDLFTFQLHPYASVHLGAEGQLGGLARDRVAGFLRALGVAPPTEPDHLVVLLIAYAELVDLDEDGGGARARHARTALLHEHLWPWVPGFATRAAELGAAPYRRWATLLHDALAGEVTLLGPPPTLPAHLRDAPGLPDPREGPPRSFVDGLLAPVRSGLVLARADLARIARDLDLGLRVGERAYLLRALLAQDGPATLQALADEATRQHGQVQGADPTVGFRRDRLTAAGELLADLATSSDALPVPG